MLVAVTKVVTGLSAPSEIQTNVIMLQNPVHLLAYVTPKVQVTTIHHVSRLSSTLEQPTTQWNDW
jgi:hypothetical protein